MSTNESLALDNLKIADCPERLLLDHVTSRWGTLILLLLLDRTHRFSELRQRIGGVSEKMLAQTLRILEHDGFVNRQAFAEVPPRVEYSLTPMGREVAAHLGALGRWIRENLERVNAARIQHQKR
jgi:DNA-binding HxlR family transcriptional regulator